MVEEHIDNYMERADPEDKIRVIKQALGAVEKKIANLKEMSRNPNVPDSQKQGLEKDITEAEERLETLRKELEILKGKSPTADQP